MEENRAVENNLGKSHRAVGSKVMMLEPSEQQRVVFSDEEMDARDPAYVPQDVDGQYQDTFGDYPTEERMMEG